MKITRNGNTTTIEGLTDEAVAIIEQAVKADMKNKINYYEEEIANAEAYVMNSPMRAITEMRLNALRKEYAEMMASHSSVLAPFEKRNSLNL